MHVTRHMCRKPGPVLRAWRDTGRVSGGRKRTRPGSRSEQQVDMRRTHAVNLICARWRGGRGIFNFDAKPNRTSGHSGHFNWSRRRGERDSVAGPPHHPRDLVPESLRAGPLVESGSCCETRALQAAVLSGATTTPIRSVRLWAGGQNAGACVILPPGGSCAPAPDSESGRVILMTGRRPRFMGCHCDDCRRRRAALAICTQHRQWSDWS